MRAQFKHVDDMPKELKCCAKTIKYAAKLCEHFGIFELSGNIITIDHLTCIYCGNIETNLKGIYLPSICQNIPIDSIDIDEGQQWT